MRDLWSAHNRVTRIAPLIIPCISPRLKLRGNRNALNLYEQESMSRWLIHRLIN